MTLAPRSLLALLLLGPAIRLPTRVSLTLCPLPLVHVCPHQPGYGTTERVATDPTPSFIAYRPQVNIPTENLSITGAPAPHTIINLPARAVVHDPSLPLPHGANTLPAPGRTISKQRVPASARPSIPTTAHHSLSRALPPRLSSQQLPRAAPSDTPSAASPVCCDAMGLVETRGNTLRAQCQQ